MKFTTQKKIEIGVTVFLFLLAVVSSTILTIKIYKEIEKDNEWTEKWTCVEWDLQNEQHYADKCNKDAHILFLHNENGVTCMNQTGVEELAVKCTKQVWSRERR